MTLLISWNLLKTVEQNIFSSSLEPQVKFNNYFLVYSDCILFVLFFPALCSDLNKGLGQPYSKLVKMQSMGRIQQVVHFGWSIVGD
jgi:hypothetical protein